MGSLSGVFNQSSKTGRCIANLHKITVFMWAAKRMLINHEKRQKDLLDLDL